MRVILLSSLKVILYKLIKLYSNPDRDPYIDVMGCFAFWKSTEIPRDRVLNWNRGDGVQRGPINMSAINWSIVPAPGYYGDGEFD
jgi:hypothetical protein